MNPWIDNTNSNVPVLLEDGAVPTTDATLHAGEDLTNDVQKVEQRNTPFVITTQTTTVVKSGSGFLHNIIISTPVASAVVNIYDNTVGSGTQIIPTLTLPATLLNNGPMSVIVDAAFSTGLTIVTSGATMGVGGTFR